MSGTFRIAAIAGAALLVASCEAPPVLTSQNGYRGTGMQQVRHPATVNRLAAANYVPPPPYPLEPDTGGERAAQAYQNVQVLGDLSPDEFNRLMASITEWIAPKEGCNYCHNPENMASDAVYTKVVARKMLQMTRNINTNWGPHVGKTGVTCWTCHRGNAVPVNHWSFQPGPANGPMSITGNRHGQNNPVTQVAYASLPNDPFTPYLLNGQQIRVQGSTFPAAEHVVPIAAAEATYGLMMHMSNALGVNCTFCHNSRAFQSWSQSAPQRAVAWYGIRMVRNINNDYIHPLTAVFPANRVGPMGDPYKANCTTCHQGVNKPLNGAKMLDDHPALRGPRVLAAAAPQSAATGPANAPVVATVAVAVIRVPPAVGRSAAAAMQQ